MGQARTRRGRLTAIESDDVGSGEVRTACPACLGSGLVTALSGSPAISGEYGTRGCGLCQGSGWIIKKDGRPENQDLEKLNGTPPSDRHEFRNNQHEETHTMRKPSLPSNAQTQRAAMEEESRRQAAILDRFAASTTRRNGTAGHPAANREQLARMIASPRNVDGRCEVRLDADREQMARAIARGAAKEPAPELTPIVLCPRCRGQKTVPGEFYSNQAQQPCPVCDARGFLDWDDPAATGTEQ